MIEKKEPPTAPLRHPAPPTAMNEKQPARKRRFKKILLGTISVPCVALLGLVAAVQVQWDRTFEAPYPNIQASTDPAVIAQGRYLAYGPAHCAACHSTDWPALEAGEEVPLVGGLAFHLPFGTVYSRNLTPDPETGIGSRTDGELARILRHGVRADGRAAMPFMEFHNLSDEDLTAVISFLRAQEPVRNEVPQHALNLVGKALMAFAIQPVGPQGTPPAVSPAEAPTAERGRYLANNVAGCVACHTQRNMMDGSYTGAPFSGGGEMPDDADPNKVFVTPNLTPDPETGHITAWSEDQFVARFRAGKVFPSSHMPWTMYAKMSDTDLRAIYRYLRSLPPVVNETGPTYRDKQEG